MVTLQEIQTMRQTVTQIQNSVITARAQYNAAKDNIVKSFNDVIKMLSDAEREDLFVHIAEDNDIHITLSDAETKEISGIEDVESINKIIALIDKIAESYESATDAMYQEIKDKVAKWNEILQGKAV